MGCRTCTSAPTSNMPPTGTNHQTEGILMTISREPALSPRHRTTAAPPPLKKRETSNNIHFASVLEKRKRKKKTPAARSRLCGGNNNRQKTTSILKSNTEITPRRSQSTPYPLSPTPLSLSVPLLYACVRNQTEPQYPVRCALHARRHSIGSEGE